MNRHVSLLVGIVVAMAACDGPSPTGAEVGSLEPAFSAAATTSSINVPESVTAFVSCANGGAGEEVEVTGNLHILTHTTVSNSGAMVTKSHFQPQGMSGVGQVTGDKYQATGVTQETFHGTGTFTFVNNFRFIGQGSGNNFLAHEVLHVTINANGDVTATAGNLSIECR
jgi:hypothetical protein